MDLYTRYYNIIWKKLFKEKTRNLLVEVQRRGIPVVIFLGSVVRLAVGDSDAVLRWTVPAEQVAEYETGQQAGHAHRAARYHL